MKEVEVVGVAVPEAMESNSNLFELLWINENEPGVDSSFQVHLNKSKIH